MKVLFIYRHPDMGYSIGKVFRPIEEEMKKYAEVDSIYLPVPNYSIKGLVRNIRTAQNAAHKKQYDVIHITGTEHYLLPFLKNPHKVVTVHDLGFYTQKKFSIRIFLKYILFIRALRCAQKVIFISDFSKKEAETLLQFKNGQSLVIPDPVDKHFKRVDKVFNVHNPTILQIGTKANKNLERVAEALENIHCHLRIIGKLSESQVKILHQYHIDYSNVYDLSDEGIKQEYENCDIVCFPSYYEGFGMPIIEGQAVGRVVVTSNLSPMKEVAADSAILVDPMNPKSIRKGLLIAQQEHATYVKKGFANVEKYNVQKIARQYLDVYKAL